MELFDWQVPLADKQHKGLSNPGDKFINALCAGAGKTYLACDLVRRLQVPALVIAPKRALTQWERIADSFGVSGLLVGLVNPEKISRGLCQHYDGSSWRLRRNGLVVWDEVHKSCSGENSMAGQALRTLGLSSSRVLPMSATIASSPLQMRSVGALMGLHDGTVAGFRKWLLQHGCMFDEKLKRWIFRPRGTTKPAVMASIRRDLGDRMMSLSPDEIPGFPSTQVLAELYDLSERDKAEIDKAYAEMPPKLLGAQSTDEVARLRARQRAEFAKAELLAELAADAVEDGLSPVVFVNFRDTVARVVASLSRRGVGRTAVVLGGLDKAGQEAMQRDIDAFQANEVHACVATCAAGGTALSLHDVRHERRRVSFISPGDSASEFVQVLGRIRREGGTATVQTLVLAANTVEEKVHKNVSSKLGNIEALNTEDLTP